jgi:hypothetical protein
MNGARMQRWGLLAEFDSARAIYQACEKMRDAGYQNWDAHSPFAVHGLDKAMGLKRSPVPWFSLVAGLTGASLAMLLQWWVHVVRYPLVFAGKPYFSWQAFVPVCFEVMVLFAAFGAVLGMFHLNRLPQLYHPLFRSERFERVTDDKFFISVEVSDPKFDAASTESFLKEIGATHVELVEDEL